MYVVVKLNGALADSPMAKRSPIGVEMAKLGMAPFWIGLNPRASPRTGTVTPPGKVMVEPLLATVASTMMPCTPT